MGNVADSGTPIADEDNDKERRKAMKIKSNLKAGGTVWGT